MACVRQADIMTTLSKPCSVFYLGFLVCGRAATPNRVGGVRGYPPPEIFKFYIAIDAI